MITGKSVTLLYLSTEMKRSDIGFALFCALLRTRGCIFVLFAISQVWILLFEFISKLVLHPIIVQEMSFLCRSMEIIIYSRPMYYFYMYV